jgi:hypothetical protein
MASARSCRRTSHLNHASADVETNGMAKNITSR